eukprot:297223-Pleurochrysis_carterae.AAC.1
MQPPDERRRRRSRSKQTGCGNKFGRCIAPKRPLKRESKPVTAVPTRTRSEMPFGSRAFYTALQRITSTPQRAGPAYLVRTCSQGCEPTYSASVKKLLRVRIPTHPA